MKKHLDDGWWQTFINMLCYSTEKICQLEKTPSFEQKRRFHLDADQAEDFNIRKQSQPLFSQSIYQRVLNI